KYTLLFLPSDASFIGSNSRTQHECTSQNYPLFFVPNVWVLPKINKEKQNLCLDKGYDFLEIENGVIKK
ncbi:MAG: hypothetical protein WBP64_02510, partial [Nitrososphaeraceae archaeon]